MRILYGPYRIFDVARVFHCVFDNLTPFIVCRVLNIPPYHMRNISSRIEYDDMFGGELDLPSRRIVYAEAKMASVESDIESVEEKYCAPPKVGEEAKISADDEIVD